MFCPAFSSSVIDGLVTVGFN